MESSVDLIACGNPYVNRFTIQRRHEHEAAPRRPPARQLSLLTCPPQGFEARFAY
jgi:hypothetical protein